MSGLHPQGKRGLRSSLSEVRRENGEDMTKDKMKRWWFGDYSVEVRPNHPYGIYTRLYDPDGRMVRTRAFPIDEEEHWVAEMTYVDYLMKRTKEKRKKK